MLQRLPPIPTPAAPCLQLLPTAAGACKLHVRQAACCACSRRCTRRRPAPLRPAAFLEQMQKGGDLNLIGQFGVGFYSVYLVGACLTVAVVPDLSGDEEPVWCGLLLRQPGGCLSLCQGLSKVPACLSAASSYAVDAVHVGCSACGWMQCMRLPFSVYMGAQCVPALRASLVCCGGWVWRLALHDLLHPSPA